MSLAMTAAPFGSNNNDQQPSHDMDEISRKRAVRCKTLKKREGTSSKVQAVKDCLRGDEEEEGAQMGDFNPPPPPQPMSSPSRGEEQPANVGDSPVSIEGFDNLSSNAVEDYYRQHVPYFDRMSQQPQHMPMDTNEEILNKLNKMLYLLQEQQEVRTSSVTEEVILYSFLGVFVIFVLDSFARAGKYVR
jgi:hypothetical protein